jgi:hypothetical protein
MAKKKKVLKSRAITKKEATDASFVRRFDNVLFEFPSDDMRGTVLMRGDEMVLEIPEQDGLAPCLIVGKRDGQIFRGRNGIRDEYALSISAAWCNFGEVFAGVWVEEGNELLFLFRLPR